VFGTKDEVGEALGLLDLTDEPTTLLVGQLDLVLLRCQRALDALNAYPMEQEKAISEAMGALEAVVRLAGSGGKDFGPNIKSRRERGSIDPSSRRHYQSVAGLPQSGPRRRSRAIRTSPGLGRSTYLRPATVAVPDVGWVSPTMIRMVVDFPAPFGPRNPVTRPGWAVKLTSSTAVKSP
jgi:hypothetical protein